MKVQKLAHLLLVLAYVLLVHGSCGSTMFNRPLPNCRQCFVLLDIAPAEAVPDEECNSDFESSSQFQQLCLVFAHLQSKSVTLVCMCTSQACMHHDRGSAAIIPAGELGRI